MKRLLYSLVFVVGLGACFPEEDQTNPLIAPTCYDGIKNQDEKDIDCGGRCEACLVVPVAPCARSLKTNILTIGKEEIMLSTSEFLARQESDQYYLFVVYIDTDQTLTIKLGSDYKPYQSAVYDVSSDGFFWRGKSVISYVDGYHDYAAKTGEVYLTINQGVITAEICSVTLEEENNLRPDLVISGRLVGQ